MCIFEQVLRATPDKRALLDRPEMPDNGKLLAPQELRVKEAPLDRLAQQETPV